MLGRRNGAAPGAGDAGFTSEIYAMMSEPQSGRAPWGLALLLLVANAMSFVDRMLLTLMVAPVRADLGISDTAISLLHGFAFAAFYAAAGLPLGRMADRGNRSRLMAAGVTAWSAMTMSCGFALNFGSLFLARIGVAVGEASLSPAAVSLISERFARPLVSRAIAVFQSGIFIGMALAMLGGGAMLQWFEANPATGPFEGFPPWRMAFITIGAPGLLVAALLLFVREPRRDGAGADRPPTSTRMALGYVRQHARMYAGHFLAFTAITVLAYGSLSWMATVLVRGHGVPTPVAGFKLGLALLVAGPLGVIASGILADSFAKRRLASGPMLTALVSVLLLAVATPTFALAPDLQFALAAAFLLAFAQSFPYGIASASLAVVTPDAYRGQVTALYLMISNLFGLTLGPLAVALMTDRVFMNDESVGLSLALLPLATTPLALAGLALCWKPYREAWIAAR